MKERHKAVPAVYAFLERDGSLLFTLRQNTGFEDGKYMVPSGHVEAGESLTEAMAREASEEVGIRIDPSDLELVHVMYRASHDATGERVDFFFRARTWEGEAENREPEKCAELAWLPKDRLPENTVRYLADAIKAASAGTILSEHGWGVSSQ